MKMETQQIVNLLNTSKNKYSKFVTKNGTLLTVNQRVSKVFNKFIRIKSLWLL